MCARSGDFNPHRNDAFSASILELGAPLLAGVARSGDFADKEFCGSISAVYSAAMERSALREYVTDAIKFWERCRILYNLALAAVVIIYFAIAYPQSKSTLTVDFVLGLFLLAVLANVAYCAAYLVDIFAQASGFREAWQRFRLLLFVIGTLFAAIITRFIAMGMFPSNH